MFISLKHIGMEGGADGFWGQIDKGSNVWFTHFLHMKLKLKTRYLTFPLPEKVRIIVQPPLQSGYADEKDQ